MVKFMKEQMEKAGCSIGDNFIKAINCDEKLTATGGYATGDGVRFLYYIVVLI